MAKQYTYDPRKYQGGGITDPITNMYPDLPPPAAPPGPGEPGYQGEISQGPSWWDNVKSDVRSFVKYPMKSMRTMNEIGYLPYNFDRGVEGGHVEGQPMDFAAGMLNVPGAGVKGVESLLEGKYGDSALNFASILPFAKPLKAAGFSPSAAKVLSKTTNKGLKANTTAAVYETGGSVFDPGGQPDPNTPRMSRSAINAEIARIEALQAAEAERIAQFQQNVQNQLGNYNTGAELGNLNAAGERNQKLIDSTKTIGGTYNWLDSRAKKGESFYGCTSYGCGMIRQGGAQIHGDINIDGRDYSAGDKYPIIGGNANMNGFIEANPAAMGMEVIDPQGYQDLVAGDRIVTNYGTGGRDGGQHTMIFSGQYDENGTPIIMQNRGGQYDQGISSAPLNYDFDKDDGIKVTRYTGNQQNLANELAGYQNRLDSGDFYIQPQPVLSNLQPQGIVPLTGDSLTPSPLEIAPPTMDDGGFLSPEYMNRQSLFGMGPGSALERQNFRLQGLQGRSSVIPGQGSLSGMTPLTGQAGIQQQRLTNRMMNQGMDPTQITSAGAKGVKGMRQALRSQRMENFNNSAMGKLSGNMGMLGNLGSGLILAGGDGDYDPARAKGAGALSGLGTGAQMGAALGPIGMAVGAVLGGIGGAIMGGEKAKKAENERKENKENLLASNIAAGKTNNEVRSAGVLSQYPTEGITSSYYAKMGGMMETPEYVVEGGELMMAPNNNPPKTDNNGRVTQIGKNMFKFDGDTHDAPSGGIGVEGGNSEFASQTNQVLDSGFVFSARLKANPDDYLKNI